MGKASWGRRIVGRWVFNSPPVGEMPRRGREGNTPKAWFLLFQMGFDIAPVLFLSFLPFPQIFLPRGEGLFGCSEPRLDKGALGRYPETCVDRAFLGRHLWNPYK